MQIPEPSLLRLLRMPLLALSVMPLLCACIGQDEVPPVNAAEYRGDLEALARVRVFFAHQSVGRDLIQGIAELAAEARVPLSVAKLDGGLAGPGPGVFHDNIGKNNEPLGKISEFAEVLKRNEAPGFDVALLKFCYEDLSAGSITDPRALLDQYASRVATLRAAYPNLRIVHVTSPLRADPAEWKTPIKRLLGWDTYEDADNRIRGVYNAELRKRFAGEAIFDIAEAESTLPRGKRSAFASGGNSVFTLAPAFTSDGGHLNARGRQVMAAAFVGAVAGAIRKGDRAGVDCSGSPCSPGELSNAR